MTDTTWFDLKGDARLGRCATEGCGGQPTLRMEGGGVGANYCSGCAEKIRTMTDTSKATIAAVVERLRIKASMIMLGEPIAWGSDSAVMDEAASLISALEARAETAEALNATLQAKLEKAAEALEPFAALLDPVPAGPDRKEVASLYGDLCDRFVDDCLSLTLSDFRRAASTLSTLREAADDQT